MYTVVPNMLSENAIRSGQKVRGRASLTLAAAATIVVGFFSLVRKTGTTVDLRDAPEPGSSIVASMMYPPVPRGRASPLIYSVSFAEGLVGSN